MRFLRALALVVGLIGSATLLVVDATWAQQLRMLPANAKRAQLTGYQNPFVTLNGEQMRLAPGAVIFDTNNRTILPGYLPEQADVVFTLEHTGLVMRIYILTPDEQRRLNETKR